MGGDMLPRAIEMAREIRRGRAQHSPTALYKASAGRMDVYRHAMREAGYVVPRETERAGLVCDICGYNFRTDSPRRPVSKSRDGWAVLHEDLTEDERRAVEWCLGEADAAGAREAELEKEIGRLEKQIAKYWTGQVKGRDRTIEALASTLNSVGSEIANFADRGKIADMCFAPRAVADWIKQDDEECGRVADTEDRANRVEAALREIAANEPSDSAPAVVARDALAALDTSIGDREPEDTRWRIDPDCLTATSPDGREVVFDDLLEHGQRVGLGAIPEDCEDRDGRPPYGRVVRDSFGLWIVPFTDAEERERNEKLLKPPAPCSDQPEDSIRLARTYGDGEHDDGAQTEAEALEEGQPCDSCLRATGDLKHYRGGSFCQTCIAAAIEAEHEEAESGGEPEPDGALAPETSEHRCPDDGACHHECRPGECWRVHNACPLSGYGEAWPREVVMASCERRLPEPSSSDQGEGDK
jgi:hypothetical protein